MQISLRLPLHDGYEKEGATSGRQRCRRLDNRQLCEAQGKPAHSAGRAPRYAAALCEAGQRVAAARWNEIGRHLGWVPGSGVRCRERDGAGQPCSRVYGRSNNGARRESQAAVLTKWCVHNPAAQAQQAISSDGFGSADRSCLHIGSSEIASTAFTTAQPQLAAPVSKTQDAYAGALKVGIAQTNNTPANSADFWTSSPDRGPLGRCSRPRPLHQRHPPPRMYSASPQHSQ